MTGKEKRDLEAEHKALLSQLQSLVPKQLRDQIEQAVLLTSSSPQMTVKVSHLGAFDADEE